MSIQNGVSPASQWRERFEDGIAVELPNGLTVRLRSVSVVFLAKTGKLPNSLLQTAMGALGEVEKEETQITADNIFDELIGLDEYYRVICEEAFAYPKIVDTPSNDDEISFNWLTDVDKQFVAAIINEPLAEWHTFREKFSKRMELVR